MTPAATARAEAVMATAAIRAEVADATASAGWLDAGLAIARTRAGLTFIALPAPLATPAAITDELRDEPLAAWSATGLTVVGVGVARELRGTGADRWAEVIAGAHALATGTPAAGDAGSEPARAWPPTPLIAEPADVAALRSAPTVAVIAGVLAPTTGLGFARPRFLGGAAFAPGAAAAAPWIGFGDAWFALPRWTYTHDGERALLVLAVDAAAAEERTRWHDQLAVFQAAFAAPHVPRAQPALVELTPAAAETWRAQVTAITDAIAHGELAKVVAARTCTVALAGLVRPADLLAVLDERHADCVRVLIKPPGAGTLIAATPERLVRRDGDLIECDALAGSIARSTTDPAAATKTLLGSTKDRWEHQLVVDAIRTALTAAGADIVEPRPGTDAPAVRALRHVIHLHTPFRAHLRARRHVLDLAARLHPTPAVGGTPTDVATAWIASHEPAARGWYAAPVGWFDLDGNGELAVALRSGVIAGSRAFLWAGAGIVAGSDPERELAETEVKLRAMLGALGVDDSRRGGRAD